MGGPFTGSAAASVSHSNALTRPGVGQPSLSSPPAPPFEALELSLDHADSDSDSDQALVSHAQPLPSLLPTLVLVLFNFVFSLHFTVPFNLVISFNVVIVCVVIASLALASGSLSDLQIGALHSSYASIRGSLRVSCTSLRGSLRASGRSCLGAIDERVAILALILYFHVVYPLYLTYFFGLYTVPVDHTAELWLGLKKYFFSTLYKKVRIL